jgi:hypothetical protein
MTTWLNEIDLDQAVDALDRIRKALRAFPEAQEAVESDIGLVGDFLSDADELFTEIESLEFDVDRLETKLDETQEARDARRSVETQRFYLKKRYGEEQPKDIRDYWTGNYGSTH